MADFDKTHKDLLECARWMIGMAQTARFAHDETTFLHYSEMAENAADKIEELKRQVDELTTKCNQLQKQIPDFTEIKHGNIRSVTRNNITVSIKYIKNRALPHLVLEFPDDEQNIATFKDEHTAEWFSEVMDDFFRC